MFLDRQLARTRPIGESVETLANQAASCWPLKSCTMAASSHNPYPRSPNPSTRSYDSSSVSSAASPKPPAAPFLGALMSTGARATAAPAPHPIGIPPLPPLSKAAPFQPYTPVTAGSAMGRDSLPSNDSVASTPGPSNAQLAPGVGVGVGGGIGSGGGGGGGGRRQLAGPAEARVPTAAQGPQLRCLPREKGQMRRPRRRQAAPSARAATSNAQFTKETNRRMSSIKQVQDLEKQIERVRRENSSLRRLLQEHSGQLDVDMEGVEQLPLQLPDIGADPRPRRRPNPAPHDLARARSNLRTFAKGIWKPPAQFRQPPAAAPRLRRRAARAAAAPGHRAAAARLLLVRPHHVPHPPLADLPAGRRRRVQAAGRPPRRAAVLRRHVLRRAGRRQPVHRHAPEPPDVPGRRARRGLAQDDGPVGQRLRPRPTRARWC